PQRLVQADHLGAVGGVVLFQPVGQDEPGSLIGRVVGNGLQHRLLYVHVPASCLQDPPSSLSNRGVRVNRKPADVEENRVTTKHTKKPGAASGRTQGEVLGGSPRVRRE